MNKRLKKKQNKQKILDLRKNKNVVVSCIGVHNQYGEYGRINIFVNNKIILTINVKKEDLPICLGGM